MTGHVVVVGAGIVGVSTAIWLKRMGAGEVTLIDRAAPGEGTSHGNGGVLASCAVVPVTGPGMITKAPGMLLDRDYPLFLRWGYLPRLLPWLAKYLRHANDADTRRIAKGLAGVIGDSAEQHVALAGGTAAEEWVRLSDYSYAYANRAAFEADRYTWELRRENGFTPVLREGAEVQAFEPALSPEITLLATMADHGYIRDPGGYVKALARVFEGMGGAVRQAAVRDVQMEGGRVRAVLTDQGTVPCARLVLATGAWSKPLMAKLGINVPLESERGYHIVFEAAEGAPSHPLMVASGKFVATPMAQGLRCAGIVEFGGLEAGPSEAPFAFLRRHAARAFPGLKATGEVEWMGHRPCPADSLPLIGEVGQSGVFAGFGHHHIGLTGGPKTGRMLAGMITGQPANTDPAPYDPDRFG